jgi:NNP family nitrate/nitrite transporter-like MFS transporter
VIFAQGLAMIVFSRITALREATTAFLVFGVLVCVACGVTYAVVPFVQPRAIGSVSGIVGAGGNSGALLAAMLFRSGRISGADAFLILGCIVAGASFCVLGLRFREVESGAQTEAIPLLVSAD